MRRSATGSGYTRYSGAISNRCGKADKDGRSRRATRAKRRPILFGSDTGEIAMGLLDGMIGGLVGAAMVPIVNGLLEKHGGVQGIVNQFQSNGLGATVNSWVAKGPNPPVTA